MFIINEVKTRDQIDEMVVKEHTKEVKTVSNPSSFRDVHVYDSTCDSITLPTYTSEEKAQSIKHLQSLFRHPLANRMLDTILSRNNYDPSNNIDSADLLHWICTHPITPDLFFLLEEQVADNFFLGSCLQGSSHRIRQIYYAMNS